MGEEASEQRKVIVGAFFALTSKSPYKVGLVSLEGHAKGAFRHQRPSVDECDRPDILGFSCPEDGVGLQLKRSARTQCASTEDRPYFINNDRSKSFDQVNVAETAGLVQSIPAGWHRAMLGRRSGPDARVEQPALA
jgi:hypothetical protein